MKAQKRPLALWTKSYRYPVIMEQNALKVLTFVRKLTFTLARRNLLVKVLIYI